MTTQTKNQLETVIAAIMRNLTAKIITCLYSALLLLSQALLENVEEEKLEVLKDNLHFKQECKFMHRKFESMMKAVAELAKKVPIYIFYEYLFFDTDTFELSILI
ncbi:hypothetical protein PHYBLDRAFT_64467 [Phycomyces blakesleeanus NRRL 1555(-)]|uniref:Uncharacterized protein n=1 Tax=Phycomyces blakesleeanus (strain ATCC 8743b / DSM 1359 / FGSC 10004 / NBRC 33097 / NRRL 1555) TaxID=763407 RepID=A0A167NB50_PHYB8|nr:hypothetical protein PHYBLDRAFT_64467 [Phycomyces blakesleeanus NRRL 1555(-)]OAD75554.1 hypothetical protein PHYBLDRAFT_64467 [Phycomyces blakesleeanus NRRL 1555(-)]|eukprot:XP_018293594.1 hypothetical protein PHYBLDRAFT_64467 [Phycomyces blakesleeanus NRRL 1555(-)]